MSLHFIKSGLQTSIQDSGRTGLMHNGIAHSGAMDIVAMQMANWLVSKPVNAAAIEVTLIGPTICFTVAMTIAVYGAKFDLYLNDEKIFNDQTIQVAAGDILTFDKLRSGARAYLAVSDEFSIDRVLGSYSTHLTANFGGYLGRQLKNNDQIATRQRQTDTKVKLRQIPVSYQLGYSGMYLLRCVNSVESELFSETQKHTFFSQKHKISANSNRMGIRLEAKPVEFKQPIQIISSGLVQGSIQVTPSGQGIISSVDGQTIGGYPRIANVISADLPVLGQLKANDKISFSLITKAQALLILKEKQRKLEKLFS